MRNRQVVASVGGMRASRKHRAGPDADGACPVDEFRPTIAGPTLGRNSYEQSRCLRARDARRRDARARPAGRRSPRRLRARRLGDALGPVIGAVAEESMGRTEALLLGRRTYEDFCSYWPDQTDILSRSRSRTPGVRCVADPAGAALPEQLHASRGRRCRGGDQAQGGSRPTSRPNRAEI
jgi:hypothetical protein